MVYIYEVEDLVINRNMSKVLTELHLHEENWDYIPNHFSTEEELIQTCESLKEYVSGLKYGKLVILKHISF